MMPTIPANRPNTPRRDRAALDTGVWEHIRRLVTEVPAEGQREQKKNRTHVCLLCGARLRVSKNKKKNTWLTTVPLRHLAKKHPQEKAAAEHNEKKKMKAEQKQATMLQMGTSEGRFALSKTEVARASQAKWYVYASQRIPKRTFCDRGKDSCRPR